MFLATMVSHQEVWSQGMLMSSKNLEIGYVPLGLSRHPFLINDTSIIKGTYINKTGFTVKIDIFNNYVSSDNVEEGELGNDEVNGFGMMFGYEKGDITHINYNHIGTIVSNPDKSLAQYYCMFYSSILFHSASRLQFPLRTGAGLSYAKADDDGRLSFNWYTNFGFKLYITQRIGVYAGATLMESLNFKSQISLTTKMYLDCGLTFSFNSKKVYGN